MDSEGERRIGVTAGVAAYAMWGLFPLYFHALHPATALEIFGMRVVCSLVVAGGLTRGIRWWRELSGDTIRRLVTAAVLLSSNWLLYVWAVATDQVVEGALGYFINPLVTVTLGVIVLGERLRRAQWVAVGLGVVAVGVLTISYGRIPWIALVLAGTFAGYGFQKKHIALSPARSLLVETAVVTPVAVIVLAILATRSQLTIFGEGTAHTLAMTAIGPVTMAPLMCFAAAARRIPLTLLGLLQYLTPVGQFIVGVGVLSEPVPATRWVGFILVWAALAVLSVDGWRFRGAQAPSTADAHLRPETSAP